MRRMTRALTSLTAAGCAALALAACGGDGGGGERSASPQQRAQDAALKFARCMRENGVDVPDPQVGDNGMVMVAPGEGQGPDPSDPKVRAATEKCGKHLDVGGEAQDQRLSPEQRDAFVAYARCMREEGVNVPDPSAEDGGIVGRVGDPDLPDPNSPAFKRAHGVCDKHLSELEDDVAPEESRR